MGANRQGESPDVTRWAVFLDRDGVLNEPASHPLTGLGESPHSPKEVQLTPSCADAIRMMRELGALLVVVSNQPSAAKGFVTRGELDLVHAEVAAQLAAQRASPDDWRYCFHHPDGTDPALGTRCGCRKPAPGMLAAAACDLEIDLETSWMIGDGDADVLAGRAASCRTILVEHPATSHRRGAVTPDASATDILAAACIVANSHATCVEFTPTGQRGEQ